MDIFYLFACPRVRIYVYIYKVSFISYPNVLSFQMGYRRYFWSTEQHRNGSCLNRPNRLNDYCESKAVTRQIITNFWSTYVE